MSVSNMIRGKARGPQPDPDAWFEDQTMGKRAAFNPNMEITEGPFATQSYSDPVAQRQTRAQYGNGGMDKKATIGASDFNSPVGPGFQKDLQNSRGPFGGSGPVYGHDKGELGPPAIPPMKVDSAPKRGSKKTVQMVMAGKSKRLKDDYPNASVDESKPQRPGEGKPTNIDADDHNRSAWTHSGPGGQSAMHSGQMKLSFLDGEDEGEEPQTTPDEEPVSDHDEETQSGEDEAMADDIFEEDEDDEEEAEEERAPPGEIIALDDNTAANRLKFACVPLRYVEDIHSVFPLYEFSKEASGAQDYLARDDAHPLTLLAALDGMLGDEWRSWEPETIKDEAEKEAGVELSGLNMNKIMAVKIAMKRPQSVYGDWHILEKVSVALDGDQPSMDEIEDVSPETLSHAFAVVRKVAKGKVSDEVKKYAAARLYDAGYVMAPPTLAFADPELKKLVGDEDLRQKVAEGYTNALGGSAPSPDSENPVDIQVNRIMANHQYVLDKVDESASQIG